MFLFYCWYCHAYDWASIKCDYRSFSITYAMFKGCFFANNFTLSHTCSLCRFILHIESPLKYGLRLVIVGWCVCVYDVIIFFVIWWLTDVLIFICFHSRFLCWALLSMPFLIWQKWCSMVILTNTIERHGIMDACTNRYLSIASQSIYSSQINILQSSFHQCSFHASKTWLPNTIQYTN